MRPGRTLIVLGSVLTALSLIGIAVSAWLFVAPLARGFGDMMSAPILTSPEQRVLTFSQGDYTVYTSQATDGTATDALPAVSVASPEGQLLAMRSESGETLDRASTQFFSVSAFTVPADGQYSVRVDGSPGGQVIVARGVLAAFGAAVPGLLFGVASFLVLVIGLVLLIIGLVRRHRSRRGPPPGPWGGQYPPPTGQYPPPTGQYPQPSGPYAQPQ